MPLSDWTSPVIYALAFLTIGRLALDVRKSSLVRARPSLDGTLLFSIDQLAHVLVVGATTMIVVGRVPDIGIVSVIWNVQKERVLIVTAVMLVFVFPVGYLIRYLLDPLSEQLAVANQEAETAGESFEDLANAGLYIGWLERALLIIAFAVGSITAVGLIVGAKSIVRYPRFQSRAFAEYFLIGTLISVASAALGGWIMRLALSQ